jgi:hypothetical protein
MREMDPEFELFDIVHVRAGDWIAGDATGTEMARLGETRGTAREFKNTGNKARMLLKTKDITFLNAANCARFARKLARIERSLGAKQRILCKSNRNFRAGTSGLPQRTKGAT